MRVLLLHLDPTKNAQSVVGRLVLLMDLSRWCRGSSHAIVEAQEVHRCRVRCRCRCLACRWLCRLLGCGASHRRTTRGSKEVTSDPRLALFLRRHLVHRKSPCSAAWKAFPRVPSTQSSSILSATDACDVGVGVVPAQRPLGLLCGLS